MWALEAPSITARTSYTTSISRVMNEDLKERLDSIVDDVVSASDDFVAAATAGTIASIPTTVGVGSVTAAELKAVYKQRFAKLGAPGRRLYDELITSPPNGKCPLCAHRDVATLDHYLPQAKYPALVVAPINLVPACTDCNKAKLDVKPESAETVTLHPYFDHVESYDWLVAEVAETAPASVRFAVEAPAEWPAVLSERVRHHFRLFGLPKLYSAQAAEELVNIRHDLERILGAEGQTGVAAHLGFMASSRASAHRNSWQTATYRAFAESTWFCAGGFTA